MAPAALSRSGKSRCSPGWPGVRPMRRSPGFLASNLEQSESISSEFSPSSASKTAPPLRVSSRARATPRSSLIQAGINRRGQARPRPGRETALQKITAGRRFPIDHLAGHENSGELAQHQSLVELAPADTSGGRNRLGDWTRSTQRQRKFLYAREKPLAIGAIAGEKSFEQGNSSVAQFPGAKPVARVGQIKDAFAQFFDRELRFEVDLQDWLWDRAQHAAEPIDRAAFQP